MEAVDIRQAGCKQCRNHLVIDFTLRWGDGRFRGLRKYRCLAARSAIYKLKVCPLLLEKQAEKA